MYCNDLLPERFGKIREYALGKTSGKANIRKNLESLGLELDEKSMKKVTERIIQLGDRKELVTQEDLPYIISDVLKHDGEKNKVRLLSYFVTLAQGLKPMATSVLFLSMDRPIKKAPLVTVNMMLLFVHCAKYIKELLEESFLC